MRREAFQSQGEPSSGLKSLNLVLLSCVRSVTESMSDADREDESAVTSPITWLQEFTFIRRSN